MSKALNHSISFAKEVPLASCVDVLVVGGGPAGVAAAVMAARGGASVFLAEACSFFGGLGTAALVPAFMNFTDGVNFLAGGIGKEIYDKTQKNRPSYMHKGSIKVEQLKLIYDDMLTKAGVDFRFESKLVGLLQEGERVTHGVFSGKSELFAVSASVVIDATGDALVCHMAGAPCKKGDEDGKMMAGTLCALWADIEWDLVGPAKERLEEAYNDGVFTTLDLHMPGVWRIGNHLGGTNIGHAYDVDGTDEVSLTKALVFSRKLMLEFERYYKEYVKGYAYMEPVISGSMMGIRETRRIVGDYVLNLEDFHNRAVFEDEIGRYSYPVDIHASSSSKESYEKFINEHTKLRYKDGENYGIPYRSLLPKNLENVLVAGRSISTDRYMQSSVRVMPGCYITGQAAGAAAALCKDSGNVRKVDIATLRSFLLDQGAFLPPVK